MSAARRAARAGRNLLIALLIGAVIVVAIVIAYVTGRNSGTTPAGPTSAPVATVTATASGGTDTDAAPTGCLGGEARTNAMLLSAQKAAQHSTYGAVEVATAFYRWSYRYPVPSTADIKAVELIFVLRIGRSVMLECSTSVGGAWTVVHRAASANDRAASVLVSTSVS